MFRRVVSVVAACGLGLALASPAVAAIREVEGGTWDAGENGTKVWSYYFHPDKWHGSSVKPAGAAVLQSACTEPGLTSRASAPSKAFRVDKSYYRFCV